MCIDYEKSMCIMLLLVEVGHKFMLFQEEAKQICECGKIMMKTN